MRAFVSINIPENIQKQILKIQTHLPEFLGKKTEPENLHLTLKFLGEISDEKVVEIRERLRKVRYNNYQTYLGYSGFFDNQKYGVVWLYLPNCEGLQKILDETIYEVGFEKESRFMSHLTIARVKKISDKEKFIEEIKQIKIPKISFQVNKFYLMKSESCGDERKYSIIEEYNLN